MAGHDIIVVGGSAGALEGLIRIVRALPANLPAALFVVLHTGAESPSFLATILKRAGRLAARVARDGEMIEKGYIYCPPADHHLTLKQGVVQVGRGPTENGFRPAVDPLFRSAARGYGSRVIGVVLSGALDDGVAGLLQVKARGGLAIVQNPEEAVVPSMPLAAIKHVEVDHIAAIAEIPPLLERLVQEPAKGEEPMSGQAKKKSIGDEVDDILDAATGKKPASGFTCPDCGGALWESENGKLLRFRCHVGYAYTADALMAEQNGRLDAVLWSALRALVESAALRRRMADRAAKGRLSAIADKYLERAVHDEARAAALREFLTGEQVTRKRTRTRSSSGKRAAGKRKKRP